MSGFGRSNSLSINTGASNSLFSASNKPLASGGLFSNASSNPPTGNLFGQQNSGSATQTQSGGLFSQNTSAPSQTGGLFGASTTTQPQQSGGLFGNLQKPAQQSGTLFGNAQQSQPQQTTSLFGGTLNQGQNQNQTQSGGLFGGLGQQNKPATPSLFTNTAQQQQPPLLNNMSAQQSSSFFPNMSQRNAQPVQGGSQLWDNTRPTLTLGGHSVAAPAASGSVAGVKIDLSNIKPTTRFGELHEEIQKEIVRVDELIQQQISYKDQIASAMPKHAETMSYIPNDVAYLTDRLSLVESVLDNDAAEIQCIKESISQDAKDSRLSFMAIENLKLPSQFHHSGMGFALPSKSIPAPSIDDSTSDDFTTNTDLVSYFNSKQTILDQALSTHQKHITEIESHLKTVEVSTMQKVTRLMEARERGQVDGEDGSIRVQEGLKELGDALRAVEMMILTLAGRVGEAREGVVEITLGSAGR